MATKFTLEPLAVKMGDGAVFTFWFDGNGKVTAKNSSFDNPIANSFSLVQVQDCPFATPTCTSVCYVHKLEKAEAEVHEKYRQNSRVIRQVLDDRNYRGSTENTFAARIKTSCSRGFRWHVSGDIFSLEYSYFIRNVCLKSWPVPLWIYTRSFPYVEPLLEAPNLAVNLSVDKDNLSEARILNEKYGLRICYLTVQGEVPELPVGSVIFPSHELRGRELPEPTSAPWWRSLNHNQKRMVCPPDFFGQSEQYRCGPCKKCLV